MRTFHYGVAKINHRLMIHVITLRSFRKLFFMVWTLGEDAYKRSELTLFVADGTMFIIDHQLAVSSLSSDDYYRRHGEVFILMVMSLVRYLFMQ